VIFPLPDLIAPIVREFCRKTFGAQISSVVVGDLFGPEIFGQPFSMIYTLIASFDSLLRSEASLFFENNSLFRILGNFQKNHRYLLLFLVSHIPISGRNRRYSLYFP
jgi:hypothetical protein